MAKKKQPRARNHVFEHLARQPKAAGIAEKARAGFNAKDVAERKYYAQLWVAANQSLNLLRAMADAGAIRLPFPGFDATVVALREVVKAGQ